MATDEVDRGDDGRREALVDGDQTEAIHCHTPDE